MYNEELHLRIERLEGRLEESKRGCPCKYVEPCHPRCTCIQEGSSVGCRRCCLYGSLEQRRASAKRLIANEQDLVRSREQTAEHLRELARATDTISKLHKYIWHHGNCDTKVRWTGAPCTCGLEDTLAIAASTEEFRCENPCCLALENVWDNSEDDSFNPTICDGCVSHKHNCCDWECECSDRMCVQLRGECSCAALPEPPDEQCPLHGLDVDACNEFVENDALDRMSSHPDEPGANGPIKSQWASMKEVHASMEEGYRELAGENQFPAQESLHSRWIRDTKELQAEIHADGIRHGWWQEGQERDIGEMFINFIGEIMEAWEQYRDNKGLNEIWYNDDVDPPGKPEGIPIELADTLIRMIDVAEGLGIGLAEAVIEKMEYNKKRSYRHGNKRA